MRNIRPTQSFVDKTRADQLLEKWAPILDFKSDSVKEIRDENTRLNTAMLLENQESWCIQETNSNGGGVFGAASQGNYNPVQVLLIRPTLMQPAMHVYQRFLSL
jgi:hypothetical protein